MRKICFVLITLLMFSIGCIPMYNLNTPETSKIKRVEPYTGPFSLILDTKLVEQIGVKLSTVHKTVSLDTKENNFSIKSIPSGNIVYQKTFKAERKEKQFRESFQINDTTKRYTIHLQRSARCEATARVNINGINWIVLNDFRKNKLEVTKEGLLLNGKNSIDVTIKGDRGDEINPKNYKYNC